MSEDRRNSETSIPSVRTESEDDYISSDEEFLSSVISSDDRRHHFAHTTIADHTEYFTKSLSRALQSLHLDKSLVAQAQLSGQINDKNQKLVEKYEQLHERLAAIQQQYEYHIAQKRLGTLESDIKSLSSRIDALRNGSSKLLLFKSKRSKGIAETYPIEYNQAKEKVIERSSAF